MSMPLIPGAAAPISVDAGAFMLIVIVAAVAAIAATAVASRVLLPVVVFELVLGIIIGPHVLALAQPDKFIRFFADLGLGMLFFFAGYEIDFVRIRGRPLRLGAWGWLLSLILAYSIGALLAWAGVVLSLVYTGSAMVTTAIGTLIPILSDVGEMRTRFGTYLLGAGALGEFGPLLLITLALSTGGSLKSAMILVAFIALAVAAALVAVGSLPLGWKALERSLESSSQLAVRLAVVLIFALVALATKLGLDLLLGGFAAGLIVRVTLRGREVSVFESKLTAIGYGFLIPFFFIVSGMQFDLDALIGSAAGLLKLPLFVALFLVVRGVPALVLYRGALDARDRLALAFFSSTQLPLVVAITTIAIAMGKMRPSTSAALVAAGIVSTLVFPTVGLRLRAGRAATDRDAHVDEGVGVGLAAPVLDQAAPPELLGHAGQQCETGRGLSVSVEPDQRARRLTLDDYGLGSSEPVEGAVLGLSAATSPDWSSALTMSRRIRTRSGPRRTNVGRSSVISTSPVPAPLTREVPRQWLTPRRTPRPRGPRSSLRPPFSGRADATASRGIMA